MARRVAAALTSSDDLRAEAIAFLIDAYDGVSVRPGKGLPHAQAVADVLRRAGYDERTQLLALLHDVVEDTPRTVDDVRERLRRADRRRWSAPSPRTRRSSATRSASATCAARIVAAGSPVVDVAMADKIASLRHALVTGTAVSDRKLRHYTVTLQLALAAGLAPDLCRQLDELIAQVAALSA